MKMVALGASSQVIIYITMHNLTTTINTFAQFYKLMIKCVYSKFMGCGECYTHLLLFYINDNHCHHIATEADDTISFLIALYIEIVQ